MADTKMQRRDLLKAAAGTAAAATATALGTPVRAQGNVPAVSATPLVRPADIVLTNGKIITVDRAFSIARPSPLPATASSRSARTRRWRRSRRRRPASSISRARR